MVYGGYVWIWANQQWHIQLEQLECMRTEDTPAIQ